MIIYYDFHIHSALSPCAEMEMTPGSIVGMAAVKGLHAIAVTDHNGIENVEVCLKFGEAYGVLVVPGIEVQTKEDVHVICLFPTMEALKVFYEALEPFRIAVKHNPEKFGRQVVFSEEDEVLCDVEHSLYFSYRVGLEQLYEMVEVQCGAFIPAHVDRSSFSVISNLGFVPPDLRVKTLEYSANCDIEKLQKQNPMLKRYAAIVNSDAHQLIDINEAVHSLEVSTLTTEAIIEKLKRG